MITIKLGNSLDVLKTMDAESVDCVVTSPPYWGLRDYGVDGQLGMEPTLHEHITVMVELFREVRRVLKKTGTCWLNYGDCYASSVNGRSAADTKANGKDDRTFRDKPFSTVQGNMKPKDLCMVPNRLAIALQDDGWWVRSEIIWFKPNPMPESVTDRPASAHEKIFLLTKSLKYIYDAEAVRTQPAPSSVTRWNGDIDNQKGSDRAHGGKKTLKAVGGPRKRGSKTEHTGFNKKWDSMTAKEQAANGANLKNVWKVATKPFKEAHFATFPPDLIIPCIKAGCPEDGIVLDPFGGAGTTGLVADRLGRDAILIELNPEYIEIAKARIQEDHGMFGEVQVK